MAITTSARKWAYCVAQNAQRYGVPIVIWDNGNNQTSGGECHAWIRRAVNPKPRSQATSVVYPQVLDALWEGKNSAAWGSALTEVRAEADESILWANADGLMSQKEWDSSYIQLEAKMEWFADGARIGIRYSGAGTPKLVLDSAEKERLVDSGGRGERRTERGRHEDRVVHQRNPAGGNAQKRR